MPLDPPRRQGPFQMDAHLSNPDALVLQILMKPLLGLYETRWNGTGQTRLASGDTIIYSGQEEDQSHMFGVALLMSPEAMRALVSWEPVSPRILMARYNSKGRKVTIIQCYAPTNTANANDKEEFYDQLQATINRVPKTDLKIVMGDINAKVGEDNPERELIMGKHGVGELNENGELFRDFCIFNDVVIRGTVFPHKTIHKTTWISPDGRSENQIDHFTISRKWRPVRDKNGETILQRIVQRSLKDLR